VKEAVDADSTGCRNLARAAAVICFGAAAVVNGASVNSGVFSWQLLGLCGLFFLALS
jgi:hypothetical protein